LFILCFFYYPYIPINVSRIFLQEYSNFKKINTQITKKLAYKLSELYTSDAKAFEEKWNDINVFVKYGMLSDDKFYEKAKDFCLLKNISGEYFTLEKYKEHIKPNQTDKTDTMVALYTTDRGKQDVYVTSALNKGYDVLDMATLIDSHFIGLLERKIEKFNLKRVDAETIEKLIDKDSKLESILTEEQQNKVKEIFEKAVNNKQMTVAMEPLSAEEFPVAVVMPEFMRRMKDMAATGGGMAAMMGNFPDSYNVVVNSNHAVIQKITQESSEEIQVKLAKQVYDLALLSQGMLTGKELTDFIKRSVELSVN
jgi:molecular chaperone HtpG